MIIQSNEQEVTMAGVLETAEFKIKTDDGKMFHILSNLYSDPLGAVVRELSTNCMDGHKIAGNPDLPFDIILPGKFDVGAFITFRDYGPGMPHDVVRDIFTTFGQSTKSDSNEETGCLGLGSKSPLAITDSFTVTSVNNGKKTTYSVSKDSQRKPVLAKFGSIKTDEENGLIVTVPLSKNEFDKIEDVIREQLKFFKVKPNIFQGTKLVDVFYSDDDRFVEMFENIHISKKTYVAKSNIIQGEIGYAFNDSTFMKNLSNNEKDSMFVSDEESLFLKKFFDFHAVRVFMPMGTVSFAPSREELIYDDKTNINILKELRIMYASFVTQYIDIFKKIKSVYQFTKLKGNLYSKTEDVINLDQKEIDLLRVIGFSFSDTSIHKLSFLEDDQYDSLRDIRSFSKVDDIRELRIFRSSGGNIETKTLLRKDRNNWSNNQFASETLAELSDIKNYLNIKVVFIKNNNKFIKKHISNYTMKMNDDSDEKIEIILVRFFEDSFISNYKKEMMYTLGLTSECIVSFSDIEKISNQYILDGKSPLKTYTNKPKTLKVCTLDTAPSDIKHWKNLQISSAEINKDLRGVYIPTLNNKYTSNGLIEKYSEDLYELYFKTFDDVESLQHFVELLKFFDCDMTGVKVYAGHEKNFKVTNLIHIEEYIVKKIKKTKKLNNQYALNHPTRTYNIIASTSHYTKNFKWFIQMLYGQFNKDENLNNEYREASQIFSRYDLDSLFYKKDEKLKEIIHFLRDTASLDKLKNSPIPSKKKERVPILEKLLDIKINFRDLDKDVEDCFDETAYYLTKNRSFDRSYDTGDSMVTSLLEEIHYLNKRALLESSKKMLEDLLLPKPIEILENVTNKNGFDLENDEYDLVAE